MMRLDQLPRPQRDAIRERIERMGQQWTDVHRLELADLESWLRRARKSPAEVQADKERQQMERQKAVARDGW